MTIWEFRTILEGFERLGKAVAKVPEDFDELLLAGQGDLNKGGPRILREQVIEVVEVFCQEKDGEMLLEKMGLVRP